MSQPPIGERYFLTRERIGNLADGIRSLATDTHTELDETFSSAAFDKDLRQPFVLVAFGEVNSGKSSLLNALFGQNFCPVSNLPATNRVIRYRHGSTPREADLSPSVQEHFRPLAFLRDFEPVDTPGTNSPRNENLEVTQRLIQASDLILFVFPALNPWGAATWNLVSKVPSVCHSRIALVLQQADQLEPMDVEVIRAHMAELATKRIGTIPAIFAVSAQQALASKSGSSFPQKEYRVSGLPAIEAHVSNLIYSCPLRLAALEAWRSRCSSVLGKIEDRIEDQSRALNTQNRFLDSLENEIDAMRERLVARLPRHLSAVAEVFQTEAVGVTTTLRKWLGYPRSVFRIFVGDRTGSHTEALFMERLRTAVETVAASDGKDIVEACRSHWTELGDRVSEVIGTKIDDSVQINEKLEQARHRFVTRISRAASEAVGNLHVRKELERDLRRRNLTLRSYVATTLGFLILGSTCGILNLPWLPILFCAIALLFLLGGAIISIITRARISREFQRSLLNTCGRFADALRVDYEDALRIFFHDYSTCLSSIHKHLAKERLAMQPKLKRWHDLFLTLKSIEQDF